MHPDPKAPAVRTSLRTLAAATVTGLVLVGAGACGDSGTAAGSPLDAVTVRGDDPATAPTVELAKKQLKATETVSKVLKDGDGPEVTASDIASIHALIINASDGTTVDSSWDGTPAGVDLAEPSLFPAIKTELPGKKVGSRLLIAAPPKDVFGPEGNPAAGLDGTDSVLFVIDIVAATKPLAQAEGAAVDADPALPTVEFTGSAEPAVITIPADTPPPTELVVQALITGTGAQVQTGQSVRVTYTGALWKDGSVFDSSATNGLGHFTFPVGQQRVISGWDKALTGQPVGSRLLVVIPPAEGYGPGGNPPKIAGDDTLVFVIDILAAY